MYAPPPKKATKISIPFLSMLPVKFTPDPHTNHWSCIILEEIHRKVKFSFWKPKVYVEMIRNLIHAEIARHMQAKLQRTLREEKSMISAEVGVSEGET